MPKTNIGKTARIILNRESLSLPKMLVELVSIADRQNKIYLNAHLKKTILERHNLDSQSYLDVSIKRFVDQDYLIRIGESTYMLNPYIAFKCSNPEFLILTQIYDKKKAENLLKENKKLKEKVEFEKTGNKIISNVNSILDNLEP